MLQSPHSNKIGLNEKHDSPFSDSNESSLNLDNFDLDSHMDSPKEKLSLNKDIIESKIISIYEEAYQANTKTDISFTELFSKYVYKQKGSKKLQELLDKLGVDECTYIYSFVRANI